MQATHPTPHKCAHAHMHIHTNQDEGLLNPKSRWTEGGVRIRSELPHRRAVTLRVPDADCVTARMRGFDLICTSEGVCYIGGRVKNRMSWLLFVLGSCNFLP